MGYKEVLGFFAASIALISYIPYFNNIFAKKTVPNAFSWLIWGTVNVVAVIGQLESNAGWGSLVTGVTAIICLCISAIAFIKGKGQIAPFDYFCLISTFGSFVLLFLIKSPLISILIVLIINTLGFLPTFKKSYSRPKQETAMTFSLNGLKFALAIPALQSINLASAIFPLVLLLENWMLVLLILTRRKFLI